MPPEILPQTAPAPPFTECVATDNGKDNGAASESSLSRQPAKRLQELIEKAQALPNPAARALLQECLQTVLGFYGEGLAHILAQIQRGGDEGAKILERISHDPLVTSLLIIHGLHPLSLERRFHGALEKVRPYMQSHGGNIELISIENETARVRLQGTCQTCPSSTITLELAVRKAVEEACPDLMELQVVAAETEALPA